jgi:hypothetical protein
MKTKGKSGYLKMLSLDQELEKRLDQKELT